MKVIENKFYHKMSDLSLHTESRSTLNISGYEWKDGGWST